MGHVGSLGQILENLVYALETSFQFDTHETWSEFLPQ